LNRRRRNVALAATAAGILLIALCAGRYWTRERTASNRPDAAQRYRSAALQTARAGRDFLQWMDGAVERLAPERLVGLTVEARRHAEPLHAARTALDTNPPSPELAPFARQLNLAFGHVEQAFDLFSSSAEEPPPRQIRQVLSALNHAAQAQEAFYPLRHDLPPLTDFWQLPDAPVEDVTPPDRAAPPTGVMHVDPEGHHGGFSVYVPETYTADRALPLIVALHGASGNGRDFLWTWVREAKSRGYLLVAPSSLGTTWSEAEDTGILEAISWLNRRYRVANDRILLTGLSDGATFTLLYGLAHPDIYRALAPLCGVLHPANASMGNLHRASGVSIYLVHGALDFLFPVSLARMARDQLTAAGAAVEYRELPELSHTYPRSENVRILRWFEALPKRAGN